MHRHYPNCPNCLKEGLNIYLDYNNNCRFCDTGYVFVDDWEIDKKVILQSELKDGLFIMREELNTEENVDILIWILLYENELAYRMAQEPE